MRRWTHASIGGRGTPAGKRASRDGEVPESDGDFREPEGGQLSVSPFCKAVAATERQDVEVSNHCSARTRAAVERLYRDGGRTRLVAGFFARHTEQDPDSIAELFDRSAARALEGACHVEHPAGVHRWIERDMEFALRKELERRRVARRAWKRAGNALPRPSDLPGPEAGLSQEGNAELAARLLADAKLTPRDRNIIQLVWAQRQRRAAVAGALGVSERVVKKTIEKAGSRLESTLIASCGGGCGAAEQDLVRRHAFNYRTLTDVEHAQAIEHLQSCGDCARLFSRLGEVRLGVASLTPLPLTTRPRVAERVAERFNGAVDWTRDQLTTGYHRAYELSVSPPPFRPGAALASVGACAVAAGGGYCIEQALPPIQALNRPAAERSQSEPEPVKEETQPEAQAPPSALPAPPQLPATPSPSPEPAPQPEPRPPAPAPAPPPAQEAPAPAAPQEDFGIERAQPSAPPQPSPAPSGGGGEFL